MVLPLVLYIHFNISFNQLNMMFFRKHLRGSSLAKRDQSKGVNQNLNYKIQAAEKSLIFMSDI